MPTKVSLPRMTLPDKRVRFDPFVTYLGEEPPPTELEESLHMDASVTSFGRRRPGNGVNKRRSLDLHDMLSPDSGGVGDGSSAGFGFGSFSFGGSFGSFANSSDAGMGAFLSDAVPEEEEEDLTEGSGHEAEARRKKFSQSNFLDFEKSDSSFPDLGPMTLEEESGMDGSSSEVKLSVGRATLAA